MLLAGRGYNADSIRASMGHPKVIVASRSASARSPQAHRTLLQQDQALPLGATRYDKLAANYLVFVQLALIAMASRL